MRRPHFGFLVHPKANKNVVYILVQPSFVLPSLCDSSPLRGAPILVRHTLLFLLPSLRDSSPLRGALILTLFALHFVLLSLCYSSPLR